MLEINPTNLSTETANKLRLLIAHNNNPAFLDRKLTHILPPVMELRLTHNLIIDRESTENVKRYFVISNAPHDDLGIGATNRARRIIGAIEIDTTHASLTYQPISSKVVRITNIKKAQKAHQAQQTKYKHKAAVQAFKKHQPFTHLAMQQPVKRAAHIGRNSAFFFKKKSYTVMNELPGQNLGDEIADFITYIGPDTKTMLDVVLIPILEAYKRQVASTGKVHRDIKPGNINADLYKDTPSIINFLDFDSSLAIGDKDTGYGTLGYLAPEAMGGLTVAVTPARDIFSLGVLLISCINPDLSPESIVSERKINTSKEALQFMLTQLNTHLCYDPDQITTESNEHYELFNYINDGDDISEQLQQCRNQIKTLLKNMTSRYPEKRPAIDSVIAELKAASAMLTPSPSSTLSLSPSQ